MIILADWIDIVTVSIAVLALLFTLFSTWWLYFRRGRIMVPKPRAIEAGGSYDDKPLLFDVCERCRPLPLEGRRSESVHVLCIRNEIFLETFSEVAGGLRWYA